MDAFPIRGVIVLAANDTDFERREVKRRQNFKFTSFSINRQIIDSSGSLVADKKVFQ